MSNQAFDAPAQGRVVFKEPTDQLFYREVRQLFSRWKVWEIHRNYCCPATGQEIIELCHLWRFRRTGEDRWVVEQRQLTSFRQRSVWVQVDGPGSLPGIALWPFNRSERNRAGCLRLAIFEHLEALVLDRMHRRYGLRRVHTASPLEDWVRKILRNWERGILRNDRVFVGLRCFVNDLWKRVLTPRCFSRLVSMKGFSIGVNARDVAQYVRLKPFLDPWDAHPHLWPLVGKLMARRLEEKGPWALETLTPDTVGEFLLAASNSPVQAGSMKQVRSFLCARASLVRALLRNPPRHRHLSYWSMAPNLLQELEALPLSDRAVLVGWMGQFKPRSDWKRLAERMVGRYLQSRLKDKPNKGPWPDSRLCDAAVRQRSMLEPAIAAFRRQTARKELDVWQSRLPKTHPWALENRFDHLEAALPTAEASSAERRRF